MIKCCSYMVIPLNAFGKDTRLVCQMVAAYVPKVLYDI